MVVFVLGAAGSGWRGNILIVPSLVPGITLAKGRSIHCY